MNAWCWTNKYPPPQLWFQAFGPVLTIVSQHVLDLNIAEHCLSGFEHHRTIANYPDLIKIVTLGWFYLGKSACVNKCKFQCLYLKLRRKQNEIKSHFICRTLWVYLYRQPLPYHCDSENIQIIFYPTKVGIIKLKQFFTDEYFIYICMKLPICSLCRNYK